jgi:hypothetical protein
MNEAAAGDDAVDETGTEDLTQINSPPTITGIGSSARDFNGTTQRMEGSAGAADKTAMLGEYTWEIWIRPATVSGDAMCIQYGGTSAATQAEASLGQITVDANGAVTWSWEEGAGVNLHSVTTPDGVVVIGGGWYHVAARKTDVGSGNYDMDLFISGILRARSAAELGPTGSDATGTLEWGVGGFNDASGNFFDGRIEDIRISTVPRTDAEIHESWLRSGATRRFLNVEYDKPMLGLGTAANFTISGGVTVIAATPAADRKSVVLDPAGLVLGTTYELTHGAAITDDLANPVSASPTAFMTGESVGAQAPADGVIAPAVEHVPQEFIGTKGFEGVGGGAGGAVPVTLYQRLWDLTLLEWVYYGKTFVDTAPLSGETTPNHSGSLDVATHAIVARTS